LLVSARPPSAPGRGRRALVIGGDGLIGAALGARLAARGWQVLSTTRRAATAARDRLLLDLADDVRDWQPPADLALAYLCAGVTSIAQCEADPSGTRRINVEALCSVACQLLAAGAFVVFPSTNLVFDGALPRRAADDPVGPLTEYGRQKADLEQRLLAAGEQTAVVRLTKVLSPDSRFLREWVTKLRAGETIHPFADMVMAPVTLRLATEALLQVGTRRASGITQVSALEDVTYEAAARRLAMRLGVAAELVQPIRTADAGIAPAAAPRHTTLDPTRLGQELGLSPPHAGETLDEIYAQMMAQTQ